MFTYEIRLSLKASVDAELASMRKDAVAGGRVDLVAQIDALPESSVLRATFIKGTKR